VTTEVLQAAEAEPLSAAQLTERLLAESQRYHRVHPFHQRMNAGELSREEIQRWAVNRFYYQRSIPLKDAAILANCPEPAVRRVWISRIVDHDGSDEHSGGIEGWLRLGEGLGVSRGEMLSERGVLPGVRYAVDAYVNFCRQRPWIEAVASSLTELFAPATIEERIAALEAHYPWIDSAGLDYFRSRLHLAPRDSQYALDLVIDRCRTRESQERAIDALAFKCDLLWSQLDAVARGDTRPPAAGA
jgi:pyrroloquinoline-quinone synthase